MHPEKNKAVYKRFLEGAISERKELS